MAKIFSNLFRIALLITIIMYLVNGKTPLLEFPANHSLKLAFGSCNKFFGTENSSIFYAVSDYQPDLYAWIGDAAYVENMELYYLYFTFPGPEAAREKLENAKNDPAYVKLRQNVPIVGVWDNHDFGQDGGNKNFKYKYEMKDIFLDFVDEPKNSSRRTREGIYESYDLVSSGIRTKLILLDVRFNRDDESEDILGEEQWKWLEEELQEQADVFLIASGSQIIPEDRILHDNWYSKSTLRLLNLIKKHNVSVILLSGDVHNGELMKLPCSEEVLGYPLYELTSSGLTHTTRDHFPKGEVAHRLFFPETYNTHADLYVDYNFGTIEIVPDSKNISNTTIILDIRDHDGHSRIHKSLTLGSLKRKEEPKVPFEYYTKSLCFNETKEARFYSHVFGMLNDIDVIIFLGMPTLVVFAVLILVGQIIYLCRSFKSAKKEKKE